MKLLFIINPISGGIDKDPFIRKAVAKCEKYGIRYELFKTTGKNDESNLNAVLLNFKPDKVASVGGDGTTLFSAIALMGSAIPMGIIPLGSANGMAVELSVNPHPLKALDDLIMSNVVAGLDMLEINEKYYSMHIGDVGINANLVNAYSKDKNRGMATYAKYFIEELSELKPFKITIKANGETYLQDGLMVGICNSRKYGTGIPLNMTGNPMDGKFEIVVVTQINLNSLIKAGLSKFDENFHDNQSGTLISTKEAEILFDQPRLLQLDGEIIGEFERIKINTLEGAVRLITHHDNPYLF